MLEIKSSSVPTDSTSVFPATGFLELLSRLEQ